MMNLRVAAKKDGKQIDAIVLQFVQDYGAGTLAVCTDDDGKVFTCPIKDIVLRKDECGRLLGARVV